MRNVAVQMYVSLDGVVAAPEKWSFPYWTDDHEQYAHERLLTSTPDDGWCTSGPAVGWVGTAG